MRLKVPPQDLEFACVSNPTMALPCSDRLSNYMADSPSFRGVYLLDFPPTRFHHLYVASQRTVFPIEPYQHPVVSSKV